MSWKFLVQLVQAPCRTVLLAGVGLPLLAGLTACGTMSSLGGGNDDGAGSGSLPSVSMPEMPKLPKSPTSRSVQVGWTTAWASACGFVFDPNQMRARYFSYEQSYGHNSSQMQKIQRSYDLARQDTLDKAKTSGCSKSRADEIRPVLNRYLAGDFRTE